MLYRSFCHIKNFYKMRLFIFALFLLMDIALQAQSALVFDRKLAPPLLAAKGQLAQRSVDPSLWAISVTDTAAFRHWLQQSRLDAIIESNFPAVRVFFIRVTPGLVFEWLLPSPLVTFIDRADRQPQEEVAVSNLDLSANRVNLVHGLYPAINGEGLTVSVKENDFDKEDIDFAGRILPSGGGSGFMTTHATIMATIIAGGGNSFYTGKGVAWGAQPTSANFINLFPENPIYYDTLAITVQNHSYGVGIESYYGSDAAAYDASVLQKPELLHVFSSGNRGNLLDTLGFYKGLTGFANLTGSFKMAKNILTVGSMDSLGVVPVLSSKGPAHDGRVKPELVAYGLDGSSGAAAMVSGISLLLQQAYRDVHSGRLPPAALIKAILLNSADDVETPGIDFRSGYGRANAWRAMQTVQEHRFYSGEMTQNGQQTFVLNIPAHATNLKVTIAWSDAPAPANAMKTLINDLDMELHHPASGQSWLPWTLSTFPHPDSLVQLPVRRADHLNNVEQITLENPAAGAYEIQVKGFDIKTDSQSFDLAYQWDTTEYLQWTFPARGDNILSGEETILRWETTWQNEPGRLEYSLDHGDTWLLITDTVQIASGYFRWRAPQVFSIAQFRLTVGDKVYLSENTTISQPLNLEVGFNCSDSLLLYWQALPEAIAYELYSLESTYLAPVVSTTDTFFIFDKTKFPSRFYAVAPVLGDLHTGAKSATINYNTQGVGCYVINFLADLSNDAALLRLTLGTTYQIKNVVFEKLAANRFLPLATVISENNTFIYEDENLQAGINTYRARVELLDGAVIYTEPAYVYYEGDGGYFVFPNPVSSREELNVLSREGAALRFVLFDSMGRTMLDYSLVGNIENLPMQKIASGVYHYAIFDNKTRIGQGKLVVRP